MGQRKKPLLQYSSLEWYILRLKSKKSRERRYPTQHCGRLKNYYISDTSCSFFCCEVDLQLAALIVGNAVARPKEIFEPRSVFPINDLPHRHPSKKKKKKSRKKITGKGHPRARTLVEFKEKKILISVSQYANNVGTSLFRSIHAPGSKYRYPCTQSAGGVLK